MQEDELSVRAATAEDTSFIYNAWLQSYQKRSAWAKKLQPRVFFDGHHRVIESILSRASARVWIAHPSNEAAIIIGYLVMQPAVVHWAYTKLAFRRMGVLKRLMSSAMLPEDFSYTHRTFDLDDFIMKFPKSVYNPYLAWS